MKRCLRKQASFLLRVIPSEAGTHTKPIRHAYSCITVAQKCILTQTIFRGTCHFRGQSGNLFSGAVAQLGERFNGIE